MKNHTCPICEAGALHREVSQVQHECQGKVLTVDQYIHWCDSCGMELALDEDVRDNSRAMRAAERAAAGRLTGKEINQIRKRLGLTQEQAGAILGGGPVAFCKYEKDDLAPSDAMDNLLWVLSECPNFTSNLAQRHHVSYTPATFESSIPMLLSSQGLKIGRQMVEHISHAIGSKDNWMPVVLSMRDRVASNQVIVGTFTEQDLQPQAA